MRSLSAQQSPLPTKPAPFSRQRLTEDMLTTRTPELHQWALETFRHFRSEGQFVPLSLGQDTVIFPGFDGGGGGADRLLTPRLASSTSMPTTWRGPERLRPTPASIFARALPEPMQHLPRREHGGPSSLLLPSLIGVGARLTGAQDCSHDKKRQGTHAGLSESQ